MKKKMYSSDDYLRHILEGIAKAKETRFDTKGQESFDGLRRNELKYILDVALENRRAEINLFWKRSGFYWAFLVTIYGGYFYLKANKDCCNLAPEYLVLISFLGLFFSICWFLANKGSKFWQKNWEKHIEFLGKSLIGPLFQTHCHEKKDSPIFPTAAYDYSVSKICMFASFITVVAAFGVFIRQFIETCCGNKFAYLHNCCDVLLNLNNCFFMALFLVAAIISIFLLVYLSRRNKAKNSNLSATGFFIELLGICLMMLMTLAILSEYKPCCCCYCLIGAVYLAMTCALILYHCFSKEEGQNEKEWWFECHDTNN